MTFICSAQPEIRSVTLTSGVAAGIVVFDERDFETNTKKERHHPILPAFTSGFNGLMPAPIRRLGRPWLESTASMEFRLDSASGEPKGSVTQPFSDRRHRRSRNNGADDDKNAHDRDKPHRPYPHCPCRDHDGQDYGAYNEPVHVHPPGEQPTQPGWRSSSSQS
jgi:hypothetical protein